MNQDYQFAQDLQSFKEYEEQIIEKVYKIVEKTPIQISGHIFEDLKKELVYCNKIWYHCEKGLWEIIKNPTNIIISKILKIVMEIITFIENTISSVKELKNVQFRERHETYDKQIKKFEGCTLLLDKYFKKIDTTGFTSQMINHLAELLVDNLFLNKLDVNKYQLVFKNGILSLKTGLFIPEIKAEDYVSKCIQLEYSQSSDEELKEIRNIFFKIGNANNEHTEYYSSVLGYSLLGDAVLEKVFWCLVGQKGDNGKTTILDALSFIMPDYCIKVSNKAFYENVANRHKYLAKIKGSRIVYVEENIDDKNLDASFLKEISDGRRINYEVMYGTSETIEVTCKVFIVSNNTPVFKTDGGLKNRYRQCQFNSHFGAGNTEDNYKTKEFIQDKKLLKKFENELALPLINYLVSYAVQYTNSGGLKKMPKEWQEITNETLNDNDKFSNFVEEFFTVTKKDSDRVQKDEIEHLLRSSGITLNQFRDEMRSRGITYDRFKQKNNKRGIWIGISLKEAQRFN